MALKLIGQIDPSAHVIIEEAMTLTSRGETNFFTFCADGCIRRVETNETIRANQTRESWQAMLNDFKTQGIRIYIRQY